VRATLLVSIAVVVTREPVSGTALTVFTICKWTVKAFLWDPWIVWMNKHFVAYQILSVVESPVTRDGVALPSLLMISLVSSVVCLVFKHTTTLSALQDIVLGVVNVGLQTQRLEHCAIKTATLIKLLLK